MRYNTSSPNSLDARLVGVTIVLELMSTHSVYSYVRVLASRLVLFL